MIDVDAVGISRSVRDFQTPVGRVLCVHRGGSVHIVFDLAKMFNDAIASETSACSKRGIPRERPPRDDRSWGILHGRAELPTPSITRIARSFVRSESSARTRRD
jgi:hypothetical protein